MLRLWKLEQQYASALEESTAAHTAKSEAERRADESDNQQQQTETEVSCWPVGLNSCDTWFPSVEKA